MQRTTCKPHRSPPPVRQRRTRFRFRARTSSDRLPHRDRCAVLQKAYDVLSNPKLRRTYDSVDEFDDSIPDDKPPKTEADFYKAP